MWRGVSAAQAVRVETTSLGSGTVRLAGESVLESASGAVTVVTSSMVSDGVGVRALGEIRVSAESWTAATGTVTLSSMSGSVMLNTPLMTGTGSVQVTGHDAVVVQDAVVCGGDVPLQVTASAGSTIEMRSPVWSTRSGDIEVMARGGVVRMWGEVKTIGGRGTVRVEADEIESGSAVSVQADKDVVVRGRWSMSGGGVQVIRSSLGAVVLHSDVVARHADAQLRVDGRTGVVTEGMIRCGGGVSVVAHGEAATIHMAQGVSAEQEVRVETTGVGSGTGWPVTVGQVVGL